MSGRADSIPIDLEILMKGILDTLKPMIEQVEARLIEHIDQRLLELMELQDEDGRRNAKH